MWKYIKEILKKIRDILYRNFITEYLIPVKKQILLETKPDFSDNTYLFYQELLKENYQKKYKIIWLVTNDKIEKQFYRDDVSYFKYDESSIINKIRFQYLLNSSKYVITSNRYFKRKTNRQVIVFLNHGMPLKDCSKLKMNYGTMDFTIVNSKFFIEKLSQIINTSKEKFIELNAPRNDDLFSKANDVRKKLNIEGKRVIVWLPTYRKMNNIIASSFDMPLGIPIIYDEKELSKLNKYLKERNIIMLLKPHFVEDISKIKINKYNNFKIIYNSTLDEAGIKLYELLGQSDALITDYSSVYFDYLLTKKPIGLTIDDLKEYSEEFGITYDYNKYIKGHYIKNKDDLYQFIDNLYNNNDPYKKERYSSMKRFNSDLDGNYSKKVLEYMKDRYNF